MWELNALQHVKYLQSDNLKVVLKLSIDIHQTFSAKNYELICEFSHLVLTKQYFYEETGLGRFSKDLGVISNIVSSKPKLDRIELNTIRLLYSIVILRSAVPASRGSLLVRNVESQASPSIFSTKLYIKKVSRWFLCMLNMWSTRFRDPSWSGLAGG